MKVLQFKSWGVNYRSAGISIPDFLNFTFDNVLHIYNSSTLVLKRNNCLQICFQPPSQSTSLNGRDIRDSLFCFRAGKGCARELSGLIWNMIYTCSLSMLRVNALQCEPYLREWNNITAFRIKIRYSMLLKYKVVFNKSLHLLKWLWLPFVFLMDSMWRLKRLNKKWLNQRNMESSIW